MGSGSLNFLRNNATFGGFELIMPQREDPSGHLIGWKLAVYSGEADFTFLECRVRQVELGQ